MLDFKNAINSESLRLTMAVPADAKPEGMGTVRFVCHANGDSRKVIENAKSVLKLVNEHSRSVWPSDEQWTRILPEWFLAECGPELTAEQAEQEIESERHLSVEQRAELERVARWSAADWTYWLHPNQRLWFWWDAAVLTEHDFVVAVETHEWPFPSGALKWLLRASGADTVEAEI